MASSHLTKAPNQHSLTLCYLSVGVNAFLMFVLFFWLAQTRNIDGDEGLYLEAARLVSQGKKLYLDFFFQQMPITPYLYAAWMKLFGFTLFSARYLSATLMALTGTVFLIYVARKTRTLLLINLMGLLFYGSGMILAWAPVVKTHPLNLLTLVTSAVALSVWKEKQKIWLLITAALSIGIGVNARLTLGPIIIFYLVYILVTSQRRWRDSFIFTLVVGLTSIPTFYYFLSDPDIFIRYNLTYHTQVYPGIVDMTRRLYTAQNMVQQPQILLLLITVQVGILMYLKKDLKGFIGSDEGFFTFLTLIFIAVHLSSAEPYTQYFVAVVPLLLLLALPLIQKIITFPVILSVPVLVAFFGFYLTRAPRLMKFEIASMASDRPEWALKNLLKVVSKTKKKIKPGEVCLTWWPGFAFMAGCESAPGMENHMRNYAVQKISESRLRDYKMMSDADLLEVLKERKYRVVIDNVYHIESPLYEEIQEVLSDNYWQVGDGVKVRAPSWFRALLDKS